MPLVHINNIIPHYIGWVYVNGELPPKEMLFQARYVFSDIWKQSKYSPDK